LGTRAWRGIRIYCSGRGVGGIIGAAGLLLVSLNGRRSRRGVGGTRMSKLAVLRVRGTRCHIIVSIYGTWGGFEGAVAELQRTRGDLVNDRRRVHSMLFYSTGRPCAADGRNHRVAVIVTLWLHCQGFSLLSLGSWNGMNSGRIGDRRCGG